MDIRILLVAREGDACGKYQEAIEKLGVQCDTVSTLKELYHAVIETPYNGMMIDLFTKMKASPEEKTLVQEILDHLPVLLLRWDDQTGSMKCLYSGQMIGDVTLENFVQQQCRWSKARKIRSSLRINLHLNVLLSRTSKLREENAIRSTTLDVSKGGCFLYSTDSWGTNVSVWFIFKELKDKTPIRGQVKRVVPWGKEMKAPGIGVVFKEAEDAQLEEIYNLCDPSP